MSESLLSPTEQRAYDHLIEQSPAPVSCQALALAGMDMDMSIDKVGESAYGAVIVKSIRAKIQDHKIRTLYGCGYWFTGGVE